MRLLIQMLVVGLLAGSSFAQSLGRLPGTVYPADRGARTWATLNTINTERIAAGNKPLEWYFDGTWTVTDDFTFLSTDVIHMLPGARFNISTNFTLSFAGAEFWATKQRCFIGGGTTDGLAKYPHLFPEWSAGYSYGMAPGYLDYPYAFSNVFETTTGLTNLAGNTNLLEQLLYIANNWHTLQGYANTNQLNTLSNSVSSSISNMNAIVSNSLVNAYELKTSSFNASAGIIYGCDPNGGTIVITPPADPVVGNIIQFFDAAGTAATNKPIVFIPNTKTIMGSSDPYTNNLAYSYQRFIYTGAGSAGWRLF